MKWLTIQKGFTLLETLIALAILAIALLAVVMTVQRTAHHVWQVRDKIAAHELALNVIADLQINVISVPQNGVMVGKTVLLGQPLIWVAGNEGKANYYYKRVYVEVKNATSNKTIERLIGFVKIPVDKNDL